MLPDYRLGPEDIKVSMVGWEASEFIMDEDKNYESYWKGYLVYRHQPSGYATVGAEQVLELLDIIAGQTSLIFKLCMDGHKECQARRVFEDKYEKMVGMTTSGMEEGGDLRKIRCVDATGIDVRNVEKKICCSEYATTITKISDKDSQVIDASDVDVE
ncbi:hypothetical protein M0R45_035427 [Rubus argutus]|uniref:Uncharacterized protein n=1 Tax=Rubus argutus TaxID=59490 RepID=A0AAW1VWY8_RUBAR